jgi:hypothetical protein
MGDPTTYSFTNKELIETLIKKQGLHEGIWRLIVKFGLSGVTSGPSQNEIYPTAVIPLLGVGLLRVDKEDALALDAAKVNPKPKERKK